MRVFDVIVIDAGKAAATCTAQSGFRTAMRMAGASF